MLRQVLLNPLNFILRFLVILKQEKRKEKVKKKERKRKLR